MKLKDFKGFGITLLLALLLMTFFLIIIEETGGLEREVEHIPQIIKLEEIEGDYNPPPIDKDDLIDEDIVSDPM